MRRLLAFLGAGILAFTASHAFGQSASGPTATDYQRSLGLRDAWMHLTRNVADPAAWRDASRFHYRRTVEGGFEFVTGNVAQLEVLPTFDHERLAEGLGRATGQTYAARLLPFQSIVFNEDETAITVGAEGAFWTCGLQDYVCAPMAAPPRGQPRGFGVVRDLSVPADNTPRRSPDGRYEAFVQGFNLALRTVADGQVRVLSRDGSAGDFYDPQSIAWSPDSAVVAVYRVRPGYPRQVTRVETAPRDQLQPRVQTQLYPKPGDPVDIDRPVLFHAADGRQVNVGHDLFPNPYLMSSMSFREDGRTLSLQYTERGHQRVRLIEIDAATGAARAVIDETSTTFINNGRGFRHEIGPNAAEIIWMSERDGWNHLYLIDGRTGRVRNRITRGDWVVRQVVRVDEQRRLVWFAASGMDPAADPYLQHYYRIDFDGRNLTRLTFADAYHDVSFSPDMRWYVDTYSRPDLPTVAELRDAETGERVRTLEQGDISRLTAAGFRAPEMFSAPGRDGETAIWGMIVRPTNYDPGRSYPVIENIYAGPHDSFVPRTFWPFGYHAGGDKVIGMQALADLGFIVVQIDGMGTLNRSKAFHDVAWRNLGDSGFPDRIAWHRALAARDPSYDITRGVGIYGASAGGQSALGALLFHSDFYTVAVAYNGCYDNRMDKISWNEQWMGWPVGDHYAAASGVDNAGRLQGRLLMILGEQDSNVDPASTYQVADALIRAGKDFDLIVLPGEGHAVGRSTGPIDYVQRRHFDFFVRNLLGAEPPDWNRRPAP